MKVHKENHLKNYSESLLEKYPEIKEKRRICNIKDIVNDITDYNDLVKINVSSKIKQQLRTEYKIYTYNQVAFTIRECKKGDSMKWHCDDASIISHKPDLINLYDNQIKISEKTIEQDIQYVWEPDKNVEAITKIKKNGKFFCLRT